MKTLSLTLNLLKKIAKNREKKSVGPDVFPSEIVKSVGVPMTPYLAILLKISFKMLPSQVTGK